jgi:hypothetical protein
VKDDLCYTMRQIYGYGTVVIIQYFVFGATSSYALEVLATTWRIPWHP